MSIKTLPRQLTLEELIKVAVELAEVQELNIPDVGLGAYLYKKDFATFVLGVVTDPDAIKIESPEIENLEGKLAEVQADGKAIAADPDMDFEEKLTAMQHNASKANTLREKIEELESPVGAIEAAIAAKHGDLKPEIGVDIIEVRQNEKWAKEKFGESAYPLYLLPKLDKRPAGVNNISNDDIEEGRVPVAYRSGEGAMNIVAMLPQASSLSAACKSLAALVGNEDATNGVNGTTVWMGNPVQIKAGTDVIKA